jgi:hypothetical protein
VAVLTICIYLEILKECMAYYEIANRVTVIKTNMIDGMPSALGTLRTTALRIWHQLSGRAALEVSDCPVQRSHPLQIMTFLIVKSHNILNAYPYLTVLSGAPENALPVSEVSLQSSWGACEHWEVL